MNKLLAVSLVLVIYNLFFYPKDPPLPGTLGSLLFIVTGFNFLWLAFWRGFNAHDSRYRLAAATTVLALTSTLISLFRGSFVDRSLLYLTSWGLLAVTTYLLALTHSAFGALSEFISIPAAIARHWIAAAANLARDYQAQLTHLVLPK